MKIKKELWMSLFIVFIMVFSVIGYMWGSQQAGNQVRYNNYIFTAEGSKWVTKINKNKVAFDFLPSEVKDLNLSKAISDKLKNTKMIYLIFDPNQTELEYIDYVRFDLETTLTRNINYAVISGKIYNSTNYPNLPIINCEDATEFVPVIKFLKTSKTRIDLENNCIIVETANDIETVGAKDRILYSIFGIIE